eukprot:scaffold648314_cov47-Prasinocladus_malaysianus.AAC.1
MPEYFTTSPYESLPIAARYTDDSLMAAPVQTWGVEDETRIQPAIYAHEDTAFSQDIPSNSCRALRGQPM